MLRAYPALSRMANGRMMRRVVCAVALGLLGASSYWAAQHDWTARAIPAAASLSNVETRDWYHREVAKIDDVVEQMEAEGWSKVDIAREAHRLRNEAKWRARTLMRDQALAKRLPPVLTWDEAVQRYDGDMEAIIEKSRETNLEVDRWVERERERERAVGR